jgi:membrane protein required for colicin V production
MLIDIIVVSLLALFFIVGVSQGFIVSLLSLVAWAVAIISAWLFSGFFGAMLSANVNLIPPLDLLFGAVLAFLIPFLLIRIVIGVIKFFMNKTSCITMANRVLGGAWGVVKGIVVSMIILTVISILPAKGNLQQIKEKSVAYSIYEVFPFADLWEKFKLPEAVKLQI